jgi:hypothetical protein
MCIGIHWGLIERGKHFNIMKPVQGFPQCSSANDKFIWNEDDSIYGMDVPAWRQTIHSADCNDEDCPDYCKNKFRGVFVKGVNKHVCYSYEILDSICMIIKFDKLRNEYFFHGGCYPGNQTYKLVPANPGEEHDFREVEIEIRDFSDPVIQAGEWTDYGYNFGHYWRYVSMILKILGLASIILLVYVAYDVKQIREKYKDGSGIPLGDNEVNKQIFGYE